ncbi:uncharacterized protein L201_003356 [Kwoniella dendrophila CBS 6074]|uniref:JmjC domain-containing protein n=1 Tax=Kwoniella dendrophila CBS 6074 TaxID=1295534 RepID=A0AAX4JV45_9TREE
MLRLASSTTNSQPRKPTTGPITLTLQTLQSLAQEMINTIPFNIVPEHWLRLYTDVAILQAIQNIMDDSEPLREERDVSRLESIRRLDMAIIVAGALGKGRKGWILELIKIIQARLSSKIQNVTELEQHVSKRRKLSTSEFIQSLHYAPNPIKVLEEPPSVKDYLQNHATQPFILRGFLKNNTTSPAWTACDRWASAEYLLGIVGHGRVVPIEVGKAYDDASWTQKIMPFKEFLNRAGFEIPDKTPVDPTQLPSPPLYLAQYGLFDQFPELEKDICFPDYVWSNPPPTKDAPSYSPPQNNDGLIVNVWVGSGNSEIISPAHTDPYYNCYAQVLGQKRVWLAPPSCGPQMHVYGEVGENSDDTASQYMTNTSTVPIMKPIDDFTKLATRYPEFFQHAFSQGLEAILEPGDLMIMPPGWWHAMRGEGSGPAWSVSMWF